jgi:uncharacterized protein with HEPN domain
VKRQNACPMNCAKNIPLSLGKAWPGMRDRIIHGYDNVDLQIVWDVVIRDIPEIKPKIETILADYEE